MNIPSRVNPFGYDNSIPPRYTVVEYLQVYGSQYIDTGFPFAEDVGFKVTETPTAARTILRFGVGNGSQTARCVTGLSSATSSEEPVTYYWGASIQRVGGSFVIPINYLQEAELNWKNSSMYRWHCPELDKTVQGGITKGAVDGLYGMSIYLFAANISGAANFGAEFNNFRCFSAKLSQQKDVVRDFIPVLDSTGVPCMYDTITGQPFRNSGTGQFTVGLTMTQALNLANLPATGGSMTISLPLEAEFDANVQSALNTAADKGWTITVQYRESELTSEHIPADFLESTGAQYIQLPPIPRTHKLFIDCQLLSETGQVMGYYETTDSGLRALMLETYQDISLRCCIDGAWPGFYSRNIHERYSFLFTPKTDNKLEVRSGTTVKTFNFDLAYSPTKGFGLFRAADFRPNLAAKIWEFSNWDENGTLAQNLIPTLDSSGTPCMYDTVSGQNFYNANTAEGATPFIVGFDTTEKAAISLSKLPATTGGSLTVSLPAAAQDPATRVSDAIDIATNRGWTIIAQYRED